LEFFKWRGLNIVHSLIEIRPPVMISRHMDEGMDAQTDITISVRLFFFMHLVQEMNKSESWVHVSEKNGVSHR